MYWLTFVVIALVLFVPPLYFGSFLLQQIETSELQMPFVGWHLPGWLVFWCGILIVHIVIGTLAFWATKAFFSNHFLGRMARRVSAAEFGTPASFLAVLTLAGQFIILPIVNSAYHTAYHLSNATVVFALLMLSAEVLRGLENTSWDDFDFKMHRIQELPQQGYKR